MGTESCDTDRRLREAGMIFDKSHTHPMGWDEFDLIMQKLISDISVYRQEACVCFDAIAPILRSGSIPATIIGNKLQIIPTIPLQLKHVANELQVLLPPSVPTGIDPTAPLNILVVETNNCSGASAKLAYELLKKVYPQATMHYASVSKVFGYPDLLSAYKSRHFGVITNEAFRATDVEAKARNLRYGITIFPWETTEFELNAINGHED